jgi:histidyl-tRNA synthetase
MRDMLPEDMSRFRRIEDAFRDVCHGWGYGEVRTPSIEHLHLFTAVGTLSPQMLDRVYSFLDWDGWSGERVVVRPESTIPVARLYVERLAEGGTAKLFYVQNVLRFAERDETRESWQCGVELLGEEHPHGDIESIVVAQEVLRRLGVTAEVTLSDPGIIRAILVSAGCDLAEQTALYDRILDGDTSALVEVQDRLPGVSLPLDSLLGVEGRGPEYLNNLRSALGTAIPELARPLDELGAVSAVLSEIGISHSISPALVRNFEYYTGPVFRVEIDGRRVGGGGRYDGLVSVVGGDPIAASGFALEVDIIASLIDEAPEGGARVTIRASAGEPADMAAAFKLASALRAEGHEVAIAAGESQTPRDVVVSGGRFLVTTNGSQAQMSAIDEVVRAVAGAGHD